MSPHSHHRARAASGRVAIDRLERIEGSKGRFAFSSDSPARTRSLGKVIGSLVPAGSVLSLEGGLGAGKTLIAKGICAGLGVADEVLSPSFILAEEYTGVFPVIHFDLYRLESVGEVAGIGLFDAIDGRNVVIVEWGDRLSEGALEVDVRIIMEIAGAERRDIVIEAGNAFLESFERSAR